MTERPRFRQKFEDCIECKHMIPKAPCKRSHFCKSGEFFVEKIQELEVEYELRPSYGKRRSSDD